MRHKVGRRGRSRNRELDNLFQLKKMCGRNASTCRADVERLGQLDEPRAKRIRTPQENGDLDTNAGGLPLLGGGGHQIFSLYQMTRH